MKSIDKLNLLTDAEKLTAEMLEQAKAGEWERVGSLQEIRGRLLQSGLPREITDPEMLGMQAKLKRILELDNQILSLVSSEKEQLSCLLGRLNQGRKAHRAYQMHVV